MNAPLSGKQHREYLKMQAQEAREGTKMEREESRKEQLHEIKLQEAASGANQKLGHKEQTHQAKLQEQKSPLGSRTQAAPHREGQAGPTDTVPAMLTPGEAVIPRSAAQDPKNKNAIRRMVAEGRDGYAQGTVGVGGLTGVVQLQNNLATIPKVGPRKHKMGYAEGTTEVPELAHGSIHIKESHEGLFTAKANAAGMGVQEFATKVLRAPEGHYDSSTRKQANFAKNASKWEEGVTGVPDFAQGRPDEPGFADGTVSVPQFNRGSSAQAGYVDGTEGVTTSATDWVPAPASVISETPLSFAERNQNPGNLLYVGQQGAVRGEAKPGGGNFAGFQSYDEGRKALENQLALDTQKRGLTLGQTIGKYAPETVNGKPENNTAAYKAVVGGALGIGPNEKVPPEMIPAMADVITKHEGRYAGFAPGQVEAPPEPTSWLDRTLNKIAGQDKPSVTKAQLLPPLPVGLGFASNEGGAAFGNPSITRQGAKSIPQREAIARGDYIPQPVTEAQATPVMKQKAEQARVAANIVPAVPAASATPVAETIAPEVRDTAIANYSKDQQENLDRLVADVSQKPGTEEDKKGWLANAISSVFGPSGLFNDKELMRFALVSAGGMLTGGSTGGSLRYAAKDVLQAADKRGAQEATENKMLEGKLIDAGHTAPQIKAYMASKDPADLGVPRTTTTRSGDIKAYAFESGPNARTPINFEKQTVMTGKRKGDTIWVNPQTGMSPEQYQQAVASRGDTRSIVPYEASVHGSAAQTKHLEDFSKHTNAVIKEQLEKTLGQMTDSKGQPNPKWANVSTTQTYADQATNAAIRNGMDVSDRDVALAIRPMINNAMAKAAADAHGKNKVIDFAPYIDAEVFQHKVGLARDAFQLGKGDATKDMTPTKLVTLNNQARASVTGKTPSEVEGEKVKKLKALYQEYQGEKTKWKDSDNESAFYQFAMSKLKPKKD